MKSVCVVAVYTICVWMLLSCWPGTYRIVHLLVTVQNNNIKKVKILSGNRELWAEILNRYFWNTKQ